MICPIVPPSGDSRLDPVKAQRGRNSTAPASNDFRLLTGSAESKEQEPARSAPWERRRGQRPSTSSSCRGSDGCRYSCMADRAESDAFRGPFIFSEGSIYEELCESDTTLAQGKLGIHHWPKGIRISARLD